MYRKDIQFIKVGVFVCISLSVAFFIIFMIGSDKKVFEPHYKLKCTFSDISGLRIGATVQLAGVRAGFVDDIRFSKDLMEKKIEVTLMIVDKFKKRVREDSVATISTQGLLGDKFILVSVGSADLPKLEDGGTIQTKEVVGLFDLAAKGGEIMDDLQKAAKSISGLFGDMSGGKGDIQASIKSIRNILNQAEHGKGLIHALVYDPNGEQILDDVAASVKSLKILLGDTDQGKTKRKKMASVAENINKVALNLSEITNKINRGQGTLGGLIEDPTIYNEIRSIFGKVNRNSLFKTVVRATLEENEKQVLK